MEKKGSGEVTRLLNSLQFPNGGAAAADFDRVYAELKVIASQLLKRESDKGVLQTTVLVHDALLRIRQFEPSGTQWESRGHFFATAAQAMRRILVDEARRRRAEQKRIVFVQQFVMVAAGGARPIEIDLLDLDAAMSDLHDAEPTLCEIVSLRIFGDLPANGIADLLSLSEDQVRRRMRLAQAWLIRWLRDRGKLPDGVE